MDLDPAELFDQHAMSRGSHELDAPDVEAMAGAWREASADLGIDVVAPFLFEEENVIALVRFFGRTKGTIVLPMEMAMGANRDDSARISHAASAADLFVSLVNPESYSVYDRQLFEDTLNDWGWFGPADEAPTWYTGRPWTE